MEVFVVVNFDFISGKVEGFEFFLYGILVEGMDLVLMK